MQYKYVSGCKDWLVIVCTMELELKAQCRTDLEHTLDNHKQRKKVK